MTVLASGDALASLSGHRRQQVWKASAMQKAPPLFKGVPVPQSYLELEQAPELEEVIFDHASLRLTTRTHLLKLLRPELEPLLPGFKLLKSKELRDVPDGREIHTCGFITNRQHPESAKGVMFVSLEDEEGEIELVIHPGVSEKPHIRPLLLTGSMVAVKGRMQRRHGVGNILAKHFQDLSPLLKGVQIQSRDFR
jgi:error-prone DNA polymerase